MSCELRSLALTDSFPALGTLRWQPAQAPTGLGSVRQARRWLLQRGAVQTAGPPLLCPDLFWPRPLSLTPRQPPSALETKQRVEARRPRGNACAGEKCKRNHGRVRTSLVSVFQVGPLQIAVWEARGRAIGWLHASGHRAGLRDGRRQGFSGSARPDGEASDRSAPSTTRSVSGRLNPCHLGAPDFEDGAVARAQSPWLDK